MNLVLSPKEFQALVQKNPLIRVHQNSQPVKRGASGWQDPALSDEVKSGKYRNVKVYVTESGAASHKKEEAAKYGKIVAVYDSTKEYLRGMDLLLLERSGKIKNLKRQQKWEILESFQYQRETVKPVVYKADFQYEKVLDDGQPVLVVEDVKPFDEKTGKYRTTEAFALKWKLLKHKYPTVKFILY